MSDIERPPGETQGTRGHLSDDDRAYCLRRLRGGAYYYSFAPTGVPEIDLILGAISAAGKSYHHTEQWDEGEVYDAGTCIDLIQGAANEAAEALRKTPPKEQP